MTDVPPQYQALISQAAQQLGIPVAVVAAQVQLESSWNPNAVSPTGAQGLFQFEPYTYKDYGSGNPFNPADEVQAYVRFMGDLLRQFGGNLTNALAAYNAGPGNIGAGMGYANQILSAAGSGVNISASMAADNSGVSFQNSSVSSYLPQAVNPILSLDALRSQDPMVAAIVTAVPELTDIFNQAVSGQWSVDKFIASVQNSNWWATNSDSARQVFAMMEADPATYNQNITNLDAMLQQTATQLGANMTQSQLNALAIDALTNGYDQNSAMLRQKMMDYITPVSGTHFGGQAGTDESALRAALRDLGITSSESQLDAFIKQIEGGVSSVNDATAQFRTQSAATYPAYSDLINKGVNVSDIASPYIARAQQLLEQGPGQMNIYNNLIKSALQYSVDGVPAAMPLGTFEQNVRQQPAWLNTDNAQDSMMSTAHKVLMDMGLAY